ncbi:MAG: DNA internalization-related competence protein ComEC/Rec2 [Bacilli bacterium]
MLRLKIISVYNYLKNNYFIFVIGLIFLALSLNHYHYFFLYLFFLYFLYSRYKIIFRVFLFISIIFSLNFFIHKYTFKQTDIKEVKGIITDIKELENYNKITVRDGFKKYYITDLNKKDYHLGIKIYVKGENKKITKNKIAMAFNYQEYLTHQKIVGVIKASEIKVLSNSFSILFFKEKINDYINNNFSQENLMFLRAVILGDDSLLTDEIEEDVKINGISHLFAISGLHIGILVLMLTNLFKRIKLKDKTINIIITITLFLYLVITAFSSSILRAALMWGAVTLNKKYNLKLKSLDIVSIIFILLVIINPFYIYNMGFVLSFLATFIIILMNPLLKNKNNAFQILILSIAIQIASLPIMINFNSEVNLVSFVSNIIYINLFSLILPISFLVLFLPFLSGIYNYLIIGFFKAIDLTSYINIPFRLPFFNINLTFIYYLLIVLLCVFYFNKSLKNYLSFMIVLFLLIVSNILYFNPSKEIYFFALYNGEAILLTDSFNKMNCLIDTGDGKNKEVSSYLKRKGIKRLDYLILTHNHFDHNGEALDIINNFYVKNVVVSQFDESRYASLKNTLKVRAGDIIKAGDLTFEVLAPKVKSTDENDNSIVLKVLFGEYNFLFLGDASKTIIEEVATKDLKVDVIKIAHHGSATALSHQALEVLKPKIAIIQTGEIAYFGFPSKEVIESLNYYNIKTYRTDLDYSIKYKYLFNKTTFLIENF